ncbi:phage tail protein [Pseudomonas asplenii]|uniref:p2 phage tail completion protein R (GpR) n=1 Tax=Pseudomonas asplenii TaxID=53407 RepID=A0A1H6MP47_9PSED|nr:phage tail protein [Pseudomonas fuscovaginae]SEH99661.1 P2 phage tail completion protein R (GpR) [Pseudomonas fuscovaginae]
MIRLKALTAYLVDRQLVPQEQLDSWTEQVGLQLTWADTEKGLQMGNMRYRAVISLERFNDHPGRLMALVGSWLETNDPDRHRFDLAAPEFSVEPLDLANDLFDVELVLEFVEPQYLAEDPDGEVLAFGRTWSFVPFDLWVAEHGDVSHG